MIRRDFESWLQSQALEEDPDGLMRHRFLSSWHDTISHLEDELSCHHNAWMVAAYAVWFHTPKALRTPKQANELATALGFTSDAVLRKWRQRYPTLFDDEARRKAVLRMIGDDIADVMDASVRCAVNDGNQGFQDRKMLAEMYGLYRPKSDVTLPGDGDGLRLVIAYEDHSVNATETPSDAEAGD